MVSPSTLKPSINPANSGSCSETDKTILFARQMLHNGFEIMLSHLIHMLSRDLSIIVKHSLLSKWGRKHIYNICTLGLYGVYTCQENKRSKLCLPC